MFDFTETITRLQGGTLYIGAPVSRQRDVGNVMACLEQARAALAAEAPSDTAGQQVHSDFIAWVCARW